MAVLDRTRLLQWQAHMTSQDVLHLKTGTGCWLVRSEVVPSDLFAAASLPVLQECHDLQTAPGLLPKAGIH